MNRKQTSKTKVTFDKTIQVYLDMISNTLRPGTVKSYRNAINIFINFITSNYPEITSLKDLKRSPHIEEWLLYLAKSGRSTGTKHIQVGCICRFFTDINEWGWKDCPRLGLITSKDIPIPDKCLPKPLAPEDDRKLQNILRKNKDKLFYQALLLLRKTGMRIGELRDLDINCLEKTDTGEYVLRVPIGKLHDDRIIPVDFETVEIINRIIKLRGNFLPIPHPRTGESTQFLIVKKNRRSRPTYAGLRATLSIAARKCGINKHIRPHQLRHSFATELLRAGMSLFALKELLGHKDIDMTLVYTDVTQIDLQRVYHNAVQNIKSIDLTLKQQNGQKKNDPEYILDGIDCLITKLHSIRKDYPEGKNKKKLQRIAERFRRAYQDIHDILKNQ